MVVVVGANVVVGASVVGGNCVVGGDVAGALVAAVTRADDPVVAEVPAVSD